MVIDSILFYAKYTYIGGVSPGIFQENCPRNKTARLDFFEIFIYRELMMEHVEYRSTIQSLPKEIKTKMVKYGFTVNATEEFQRFRQSGRCSFCDKNKDRKTTEVSDSNHSEEGEESEEDKLS